MDIAIRNVAIIAHVDHGKTTLVDALLQQAGAFGRNGPANERVMDTMDLEKERGITIAAKNCMLTWEGLTINIVDTPGHADFGGEVERILSMVDGALLLVDAAEGPLPQTRFVLRKALDYGLALVIVINKIDRPDSRIAQVEDEILNLLIDCGADDDHLSSPIVYAIARDGLATLSMADAPTDMRPIFESIRDHIPPPPVELNEPLSLIIANLDYSDYVGRLGIGRMKSGSLKQGDTVLVIGDGHENKGRVTRLYGYSGLERVELAEATAGMIIAVAGIEEMTIGDTLTDPEHPKPQPRITVEEPTVAMIFAANTSPFAGREGKYVTGRQVRERLWKESQKNVSIRVRDGDGPDRFEVLGRGELQLAIIIEQMRREGFELEVGRPRVIERTINGEIHEPFEKVVIDVAEDYIGIVTELMGRRRGMMTHMDSGGTGRVRLEFRIPARGLIGIRSQFLTDTRGTGIMHSIFDGYSLVTGRVPSRMSGAMVADRTCEATGYAIANLEPRGKLFLAPGEPAYMGMVIGEHSKENDIDVYVGRPKKLTNMRASSSDDTIVLTPPLRHTLDTAIEWIKDSEFIEVTPKSIRIRKRFLDPNMRKEESRIERVGD